MLVRLDFWRDLSSTSVVVLRMSKSSQEGMGLCLHRYGGLRAINCILRAMSCVAKAVNCANGSFVRLKEGAVGLHGLIELCEKRKFCFPAF